MNRQEMLERLKKGEHPLDVSIRKWQDIVSELELDSLAILDIGCSTCALCESCERACNACLYFSHYGHDCCEPETAYTLFENAYDEGEDDLVELAKNMIAELVAIKNAQKCAGFPEINE